MLEDDDEEGVDDDDEDELGDMALDDEELGGIELDDEELGGIELDDDAVELGVDDVSVDEDVLDEVLGGVEGGVVVLDELDVDGGVAGADVVVSLFCWQPASAATTAAAAAVMMKRFIDGSFGQMSRGRQRRLV